MIPSSSQPPIFKNFYGSKVRGSATDGRSSSLNNLFPVKIQNYAIGSVLGKGKFAVVKSAISLDAMRTVAIKFIPKKDLESSTFAKREADILKTLDHKHIVKFYELLETSTEMCLVMEHVKGITLLQHITTRTKLNEVESRRIFKQLMSTLSYCHSHHIVHRDIKPENIIYNPTSKEIKLIDFGFSGGVQSPQVDLTFCGSVEYASPEILSKLSFLGLEVDVWSSGVLLYVMCTGTLPFQGNEGDVASHIKQGLFQVPKFLSEELSELLTLMLDPNGKTRITVPKILEHPWCRDATDVPKNLKPPSRSPQSPHKDSKTFKTLFSIEEQEA